MTLAPPDAMLVVDQHGAVMMCSSALAQMIGRSPAELVGLPVWKLLPGWTPFGPPARHGTLCLLPGSDEAMPVSVSCEPLHLPGKTLYVARVRASTP